MTSVSHDAQLHGANRKTLPLPWASTAFRVLRHCLSLTLSTAQTVLNYAIQQRGGPVSFGMDDMARKWDRFNAVGDEHMRTAESLHCTALNLKVPFADTLSPHFRCLALHFYPRRAGQMRNHPRAARPCSIWRRVGIKGVEGALSTPLIRILIYFPR